MNQDSACICFPRHQHQRNCTQHMLYCYWSPQDPLEACFVLLSGDESCPIRAKIHHSDFQSLVCSRPSHGRNQPSRPVSFGRLSTLHRLFFGHSTHQRQRHCRVWSCKHRWFVYQLCRFQHSSCKLKKKENKGDSYSHCTKILLQRVVRLFYIPFKHLFPCPSLLSSSLISRSRPFTVMFDSTGQKGEEKKRTLPQFTAIW